jgi:alanine racemase
MDLVTIDISGIPELEAEVGTLVDLIGPYNPVDTVAAEAGTIGYEILTSLGRRYHRRTLDAGVAAAR